MDRFTFFVVTPGDILGLVLIVGVALLFAGAWTLDKIDEWKRRWKRRKSVTPPQREPREQKESAQ